MFPYALFNSGSYEPVKAKHRVKSNGKMYSFYFSFVYVSCEEHLSFYFYKDEKFMWYAQQ